MDGWHDHHACEIRYRDVRERLRDVSERIARVEQDQRTFVELMQDVRELIRLVAGRLRALGYRSEEGAGRTPRPPPPLDHETPAASPRLDELLQAAHAGRGRLLPVPIAPVGERDFADVDVAARVDGEPVGGCELAQLEPGGPVAEPRQHLALAAVDADARPDVG